MDPHQLNVAITRAQEGLCIIGKFMLSAAILVCFFKLLHYSMMVFRQVMRTC